MDGLHEGRARTDVRRDELADVKTNSVPNTTTVEPRSKGPGSKGNPPIREMI